MFISGNYNKEESYRVIMVCWSNFLGWRKRTDNDHIMIRCWNFLRRGKRTHDHLDTLGGEKWSSGWNRRQLSRLHVPFRFGVRFWWDLFTTAGQLSIFRRVRVRGRVSGRQKRVGFAPKGRLLGLLSTVWSFFRPMTLVRWRRLDWWRRRLGKRHNFFISISSYDKQKLL